MPGNTRLEIRGEDFWINGEPTYRGRAWKGHRVEGQLMNIRCVNAIFDDLNPDTRDRWAYPDTGQWDPERNLNEFLQALPEFRRHGILAVTVNLQGGSPEGYCDIQPWINTAFTAYGELRPAYLDRLSRVLERLDALGMACIVSLYYFGQDERLVDEDAIRNGVDKAVGWLLESGHTNLILEINNECGIGSWHHEISLVRNHQPDVDPRLAGNRYEHEILRPDRVHELVAQARGLTRNGRRLPVATSYRGGMIPSERVLEVSDLVLLHGNGTPQPSGIADAVARVKAMKNWRPMPIVFNEDDNTDFDKPVNDLIVAVQQHASWGFYDPGEGARGFHVRGNYRDGFQNVPINWTINTERKRQFFALMREITGGADGVSK
ncbi:MAG TPA: hypothetical protein VM491_07265 [Burkholderiaceae bacterium]|nr:hypothetical protein [Burkholderiaceae bacterium]